LLFWPHSLEIEAPHLYLNLGRRCRLAPTDH
jgi:hypothetical protein